MRRFKLCSALDTKPHKWKINNQRKIPFTEKLPPSHAVLKLHLFLIPLLNFICLAFVPQPAAWCYYIDHSDNTPLLIRENAPPDTQQTAYTIQDNLNLFSRPDPSSPMLLPASENFIAADTIDSNLPIFSLFRNPTELSRDPFANFLYANLRVKKLLEEYAELQDRAATLLDSSYQSGTMDLMTGTDTTLQPAKPQEDGNRKNDNISRALRLLKRNLSAGAATRNVVTYSPSECGNKPSGAESQKNSIFSFRELQTILDSQNHRVNTIPGATSPGYTPSGSLNYQARTNPASEQSTQQPAGKTSYNGSGEINLPWILDLPFKLFDFALAHKILALIAGFICLALVNIIFGNRS